jgi:carbon monoxide dehydrogenase subunit G
MPLLVAAFALCAHLVAMAQEPPVTIETGGEGALITVTASVDLQVDARTVWETITDYDHLAEHIPDMRRSRVLQRDGDRLLVEQTGEIRFLLFHQAIEVRMEVVESPQRRVVARAVGGNVKEMEGRYAVEPLPAGAVRLSYSGRLVPAFAVPPVLGTLVLRNVLAYQFRALAQEIVRRDALARGARQAP